jgi:hypothetical protein
MAGPVDVTEALLSEGTFGRDIEKFKQRCLAYSMVKSCDVGLDMITAEPAADGHYRLRASGHLAIETRLLLKVKMDAAGEGVLDPQSRRVEIERVTIARDFQGMFRNLLAMAGLGAGRAVNMARKDIEVIRSRVG